MPCMAARPGGLLAARTAAAQAAARQDCWVGRWAGGPAGRPAPWLTCIEDVAVVAAGLGHREQLVQQVACRGGRGGRWAECCDGGQGGGGRGSTPPQRRPRARPSSGASPRRSLRAARALAWGRCSRGRGAHGHTEGPRKYMTRRHTEGPAGSGGAEAHSLREPMQSMAMSKGWPLYSSATSCGRTTGQQIDSCVPK